MSNWALVFLGVIAGATLVTAILQVAVLLAASSLMRRIGRVANTVEQQAKPILGHLDSIGRDASRVASLATAQVERADRAIGKLGERLEDTVETIQTAVGKPVREAAALMAGVRAALAIVRNKPGHSRSRRSRSHADDEDTLFI